MILKHLGNPVSTLSRPCGIEASNSCDRFPHIRRLSTCFSQIFRSALGRRSPKLGFFFYSVRMVHIAVRFLPVLSGLASAVMAVTVRGAGWRDHSPAETTCCQEEPDREVRGSIIMEVRARNSLLIIRNTSKRLKSNKNNNSNNNNTQPCFMFVWRLLWRRQGQVELGRKRGRKFCELFLYLLELAAGCWLLALEQRIPFSVISSRVVGHYVEGGGKALSTYRMWTCRVLLNGCSQKLNLLWAAEKRKSLCIFYYFGRNLSGNSATTLPFLSLPVQSDITPHAARSAVRNKTFHHIF